LKRIIDQLAEAGAETIELVGGNPSLHPDIVEILRYCRDLGVEVAILSNTHHYAYASIEEIAPYVSALETTIHGLPEFHDRFTHPGAYRAVIANLRLWQQNKGPKQGTGITLNFTKENCAHIYDTIAHILEEGVTVDYVQVQRIGPYGRAADGSWKLHARRSCDRLPANRSPQRGITHSFRGGRRLSALPVARGSAPIRRSL